MKKFIIAFLLILTSVFAIAATTTMTKGNISFTANEIGFVQLLNLGYATTSEGALLKSIYEENLLNGQTSYGVTSATYTALTVSTTESVLGIRKGSIIKTKHTAPLTGIVSSWAKAGTLTTVTVGSWYAGGTITASTPSPTTGTGFYVTEWKTQNPLKYKKLTTTTAITTNTAVNVAHGLTGAKILSVRAKVENAANNGIFSGNIDSTKTFDVTHDDYNVIITVSNTGTAVTSKAVTVYLEYEE